MYPYFLQISKPLGAFFLLIGVFLPGLFSGECARGRCSDVLTHWGLS